MARPLRRSGLLRPTGGGGGPAAETFTAVNGTAWPADWSTGDGVATNNQTIQGNKGRLTPAGGFARAWRTGAATQTDFDLSCTVKAGAGLVTVAMSPAATAWVFPDNSHYFRMETGSTQMGYVSIRRHSGSHTELAFQFSGATPHVTDGWAVRFKRTGTQLQAKVWTAGAAEPGTWLIDVTDGSPPSPLASKMFLAADVQADFDNITG